MEFYLYGGKNLTDFGIFTLNFAETLEFKKAMGKEVGDTESEFNSYVQRGGFPSLYVSEQTEKQDDTEITDIYNSIIYKDLVERKGIRNTELLQEKYYLSDVGLLYAINGRSSTYLSGVLENIVYHELASHGYKVAVGKNGEREIDFVAEKDHKKMYIQVATRVDDAKTAEREFGAFRGITDNYPKYVLSLDKDALHSEDGIEGRYLPKFVLGL